MMSRILFSVIVVSWCVVLSQSGNATNTSTIAPTTAPTTVPPTTQIPCNYRNSTCKDCVKGTNCYWCDPSKTCFFFEATISDPKPKSCSGNKWKVGQCLIPGNVLIIAVPSAVGFVLLVIIGCVVYCCCCRKKKGRETKWDKEDAKYKRQREEVEFKAAERREDRKKKNDEIRKKYGLFKDDDEGEMGYRRFENDVA